VERRDPLVLAVRELPPLEAVVLEVVDDLEEREAEDGLDDDDEGRRGARAEAGEAGRLPREELARRVRGRGEREREEDVSPRLVREAPGALPRPREALPLEREVLAEGAEDRPRVEAPERLPKREEAGSSGVATMRWWPRLCSWVKCP
jgi:hypothetical protein